MSIEESLKNIRKNDFVRIELFDACFLFVFFDTLNNDKIFYSIMYDDINKRIYTYHSIRLETIKSIHKIGTLKEFLFLK